MNRERLVVGNWKMHAGLADAILLATKLRNGMTAVPSDVTVALAPPTVWLYPVAEVLEHSADNLTLAAQNCWPGKDGRYTGEVSAWMVSQMCRFVLVGHSERRVHHMEDERLIRAKVRSVLYYGLRPVLCVGEFRRLTADRRGRLAVRRGDTASDVFAQLRSALAELSPDELRQVVVAYEPVWAIGARRAAELPYVERVIRQLRETIDEVNKERIGRAITVLYGGSVDAAHAARIAHSAEIDGALVGTASLEPAEFLAIAAEFHGRLSRTSSE
jgi:triosephosphate isomerase